MLHQEPKHVTINQVWCINLFLLPVSFVFLYYLEIAIGKTPEDVLVRILKAK